ncbi:MULTISPECIES: hypothetical protein [Nostoc]|uniref:Knr4/Smi1-like domain-containing protein n=2 Tax=Nostoc TaxID=1177 RepID=A0ABR8IGW7_9NOSO|nr:MULTISPECIES: hypothetical protein [Nostoc]MBD2563983.1 hypothetical protein [Nostoc linckia FACHB-391]MBD2650429.1 hypothetical protein [Nostoc foliaceum FACHB-393]
MPDYLKRFNALVKDLATYPYIEIMEYVTHPPVHLTDLKAVEAHLEAPLTEAIHSFYEQTNGLKLHWRIKRDLSLEETEKLRNKSSDFYVLIAEYVDDPFANIHLLPIQDCIFKYKWEQLATAHWEKTIEFKDTIYQREDFKKQLKPFDLISSEYCMAYFFEKGNGNPSVLLLNEECSEWINSRLTDFESYIEMLLATRGIVEAREKIFATEHGDSEPPFIAGSDYWEKHYTPKIFEGSK